VAVSASPNRRKGERTVRRRWVTRRAIDDCRVSKASHIP
jgi:hypothetical protein